MLGSGVDGSDGPGVSSSGPGDAVGPQSDAPGSKMQFEVPVRRMSYRATATWTPLMTRSTEARPATETRPAWRSAAVGDPTGPPESARAIDQASTMAYARYTRPTRLPAKTAI